MNEVADKTIEAIAKLVMLTRHGDLTWSVANPGTIKTKDQDETISSSFVTNYAQKTLRLYKRMFKSRAQPFPGLSSTITLADITRNILHLPDDGWRTEVVLEIADEYGNSIWEFPKERILDDLMSVVKYKTSGAGELIDSLVNDTA